MLQFDISGHHVEVTPALEQHVIEKLGKLEDRYKNITHVNVKLRVEQSDHQAEAEVNLAGGRGTLFAQATSGDMYASIVDLHKKLNKQMEKYKDKLRDHGDGELM